MMKQKWLLGVVFAALACGVLAGCGEDASAPPSSPAPASSAAAPASSAGQPEESSPVSSAQEIPAALLQTGDTAAIGNWEITLDGVQAQDKISDDTGFGSFVPDEGNTYQVVSMTIKNVGTAIDSFLPMFSTNEDLRVRMIFDGTYEYSATTLLMGDDLMSAALNPLTTKSGILAFSLPNEVMESTEPLTLKFFNDDETVEFQIR